MWNSVLQENFICYFELILCKYLQNLYFERKTGEQITIFDIVSLDIFLMYPNLLIFQMLSRH